MLTGHLHIFFGELTGGVGLYCLILGECREPTIRKTKKGAWGNLALVTRWACFHGSAPLEQRDAEPERDAE